MRSPLARCQNLATIKCDGACIACTIIYYNIAEDIIIIAIIRQEKMNTQYPPAAAAVTFEEESESEDEECIVDALALLRVVYGEVDSADFPLPLETYEAGPCKNGQRRYLFTDAFAVLAYQTLAEWYTTKEDVQRANVYHRAVERLIAAVHDSLGKPRNRGPASKMQECAISPTGYVGLRTGKV